MPKSTDPETRRMLAEIRDRIARRENFELAEIERDRQRRDARRAVQSLRTAIRESFFRS
jgi:hypothetical protein